MAPGSSLAALDSGNQAAESRTLAVLPPGTCTKGQELPSNTYLVIVAIFLYPWEPQNVILKLSLDCPSSHNPPEEKQQPCIGQTHRAAARDASRCWSG